VGEIVDPLDRVASIITSRLTDDGTWSLSQDDLENIYDPVTLYREVYRQQLIGRETYGPASAGELITLLESIGHEDAEPRLRAAGVFLNHEDRVRLTERLVRHIRRAIVLHIPDPEVFDGMIRQFRRYDLAERAYCSTFLPLDPVVEACAAEHAENRSGGPGHRATARWYLRSLTARRVVVVTDLGPALFALLRAIGRQAGMLPPLSDDRSRSDAADAQKDPAGAAWAVFGLDARYASARDVQSRYRELMRRYHPDINPEGLEMAKRINTAYGVLVTSGDSKR
jgi:hypothetical protein